MPMLLYSSSLPVKVRDAVGLPTRCRQLPTCRRLVLVARRNCCCSRCISASEDGISAAEMPILSNTLPGWRAYQSQLPQFIGIWEVVRGQPLANQRYATGNSVAGKMPTADRRTRRDRFGR